MIRVLIVEEVRAMGEVIATVLRSEADLEVMGCATNFEQAMAQLPRCNVVLLNAALHSDSAPHLIRTVRKVAPKVKVVVMGLARTKQSILQCIEAGVAGYVLKEDSLNELLRNIRAAYNNEALVSPPIAATLMSYIAELAGLETGPEAPLPEPHNLTRREREVLHLVQQGLTNQEIAETLVIELGTVKNHVHNILRKLNVNSRRDAVHLSRAAGFWDMGLNGGGLRRPPAELPAHAERPAYAKSLAQPLGISST